MKQNIKNKIALSAMLMSVIMLTPGESYSGADGSGGGAGIFCPASVTNQPRVQLLDLYEGRINDGLEIPESDVPYEEQIEAALEKLSFDFSLQIDMKRALGKLKANHKFLPPGVGIHVPSDLGEDEAVVMPTGCVLGAIGYYESNGILKISSDAFKSLSETNKAAFWLHEAFYKLIRDIQAIRSDNGHPKKEITAKSTRLFVAQAIARSPSKDLFQLSESATWRAVSRAGTRPMAETDWWRGWSPAPGMESLFMHRGDFSPVILEKNKKILLVMEGTRELELRPVMSCRNINYIFPNQWAKYKSTSEGVLPEDCQFLSISYGTVDGFEPGYVTFKLFYDNKEILSSWAKAPDSYGGGVFNFPIYWK
jgi:hypothetical protein